MQKVNPWHLFNLYRNKVVIILALAFFSLISTQIKAQTMNNPLYDYEKWIHFGLIIGTNVADFRYEFSDNFYRDDTLLRVNIQRYPGFTLGAIANLHMGEHFDLRLIPTLLLNQRTIHYEFVDGTKEAKEIESVMIEFPLLLKFKSVRHNNVRFYVVGGVKYSYDMASQATAERDPYDPIVALYPDNYYYEFGFGFDLYFPYFKFAPELKLSRGINNLLVDYPSVYTNSFDKLFSNFLFLSFQFE